jgi:hypothetical protein
MELNLNTKDISHTQNHPASNWQMLGDLELSPQVNSKDTLELWLKEITKPLDLHTDFLNRMLNPTHQTIVRLLRPDAETKLDHIHLVVFAPSNRTLKKLIWGFFSVERLKDTKEDTVANNHTIEIYLYKEGDAILTPEKAS